MTQMRKALLLPFNLAIASAAFAADAGRNRPAGVPVRPFRGSAL